MSLNANTFGQYLFGDLMPLNVLDVTVDRYWNAMQEFVAAENQFLDQIMGILAETGTQPQIGFGTSIGGEMHRMGTLGSVEATRMGAKWYVGFPIYAYGNKQIYEVPWLKRAKMGDLAASILNATLQDIETVIKELLRALTDNVNITFADTDWPGMNAQTPGSTAPLNVRRLANADGSAGSVWYGGREIALATLNHYLVSGAANPAVAAFKLIYDALRNVNHDNQIKFAVSRATADYVQDNFGADFIMPVEILQRNLAQDFMGKYAIAGSQPLLGDGIRTRGRIKHYGEMVEWPHFPDGYIFGYDASKPAPLRRRISDLADEQGFGLAPADPNMPDVQTHPLVRKQWRRIQGFGTQNRVNGVMVQITTNGAYTAPTL